jgi:hypothetical protein
MDRQTNKQTDKQIIKPKNELRRRSRDQIICLLASVIRIFNLDGRLVDNLDLPFTLSTRGRLAFTDDNIYISDGVGTVHTCNLNSRQISLYIKTGLRQPGPLALDPVSGYLLISEMEDGDRASVAVYDTCTRRQIVASRLPGGDPIVDMIVIYDEVYVSTRRHVFRARLPGRDLYLCVPGALD